VCPRRDQRVVVLGRTIKGIGNIREDRRGKRKVVADPAEVADVRRRDEAGEQIDGLIRRAFFGKRHHCRPHGGMKALHVGAGVAWRRDLDQPGRVGTAKFLAILGKEHRQVVADGLGKAGGGHADQLRPIFGGDVFQTLFKVGAAAINRMLFAKRGGSDIDRLVVVADDIAAHIGGAAL
jgi:hypothetical protein